MATDIVELNPGSGGAKILVDRIGVNDVPSSKIVLGAEETNDGFVSSTNPMPVIDPLISPTTSVVTVSAVSPGGQATLDSAQVTNTKTAKLLKVIVASSAPFKAQLRTLAEGVASGDKAIGYSGAQREWVWTTPGKSFVTATGTATAGLDGFRVVATNLDTGSNATDFYATFYWDETS